MTENINNLPYLPISNAKIIESLKGKSDKELEELNKMGVTSGVLFMIGQGHAKQLREDVFGQLSAFLKVDISAEASPPQNP